MMDYEYDSWINHVAPKTGDIIALFDDRYKDDRYGMIMMHDEFGAVVIYKAGFDYLKDVFLDIKHIYRPAHPAWYSPWHWASIEDKVKSFYTATKRYIKKEDLEDELGYKIEFI